MISQALSPIMDGVLVYVNSIVSSGLANLKHPHDDPKVPPRLRDVEQVPMIVQDPLRIGGIFSKVEISSIGNGRVTLAIANGCSNRWAVILFHAPQLTLQKRGENLQTKFNQVTSICGDLFPECVQDSLCIHLVVESLMASIQCTVGLLHQQLRDNLVVRHWDPLGSILCLVHLPSLLVPHYHLPYFDLPQLILGPIHELLIGDLAPQHKGGPGSY